MSAIKELIASASPETVKTVEKIHKGAINAALYESDKAFVLSTERNENANERRAACSCSWKAGYSGRVNYHFWKETNQEVKNLLMALRVEWAGY